MERSLADSGNPSRGEGGDVKLCLESRNKSLMFVIVFSCSYSIAIAHTCVFTSLIFAIHCLHHIHHSYLSVSFISM